MTRLLLFSVTLFLSINVASSQEVQWQTDLNKAIEQSVKSKKPLMLFYTGSDWCGWCIRLQNEVFKTKEFTDWATKNTIPIELDFPRRTKLDPALQKQNNELAQKFNVTGFPTVWFVRPVKNGNTYNLEPVGKTGYVAGGPSAWIAGSNQIISK
jgi:thioredoxin-related protein